MAVWLIIGAAMLLIAGPIVWTMPTARDRALKRLRDRARELDLNVQMQRIPHPDPVAAARVSASGVDREPKLEVAAYVRPLKLPTRIEPRHVPSWRVLHGSPGREDAGLPPGWRFDRAGLPLTDANLEALSAVLERTPRGTVAVECNAQSCALCWRERGAEEVVAEIRDVLDALAELQLDLARAAQEQADVD